MTIRKVVSFFAATATAFGCSAGPTQDRADAASAVRATDAGTVVPDLGLRDAAARPKAGDASAAIGGNAESAAGSGGSTAADVSGTDGDSQPSGSPRAGDGASNPGSTSGGHSAGDPMTPAGEPEVTYVELEADVAEILATDLDHPSDLAWNPYVADELWVVNHGDSSTTIIKGASQPTRSALRRKDPEGARHFMPQPTGLAFGARETTILDASGKMVEGTFATCPEAPDSFMGPTLWTSDLRIFGISKEDREPPFNGDNTGAEGPGSHIDMLHRTPTCTGIAWEGSGSIYWTYSGANAQLVRYDFAKDHGIGNDDHSDGSEWRYAIAGARYVPGVPSHLAWDAGGKRLFMADTGNARVVTFDAATISMQTPMSQGENVDMLEVALDMSGGQWVEFLGGDYGLKLPSGVELHAQRLYVSDNETSTVHRFGLDGTPLGKLHIDLPPRSLAGIAFGADGKLYFVDMNGSRVLRAETAF